MLAREWAGEGGAKEPNSSLCGQPASIPTSAISAALRVNCGAGAATTGTLLRGIMERFTVLFGDACAEELGTTVTTVSLRDVSPAAAAAWDVSEWCAPSWASSTSRAHCAMVLAPARLRAVLAVALAGVLVMMVLAVMAWLGAGVSASRRTVLEDDWVEGRLCLPPGDAMGASACRPLALQPVFLRR